MSYQPRRRRLPTWLPFAAGVALVLAFLTPVLAAPPENLNMFDAAGEQAASIRDLFYLVLAITGSIFVLVQGILLYSIFRFRDKGTPSEIEPPQVYGSKPIEIAWTVAPTLTVFVLFLVVMRYINDIRATEAKPDAMRVIVVGHQWWWEYQYPELGIITANELHIPAGRKVHLELQSVDVIHSFWVPRLAGKTDVVPNKINHMWIEADPKDMGAKPEVVYLGQCAEYCKGQHANMMIRVVAQPPDRFQEWVASQQKPAVDDPSVKAARDYFFSLNCQTCHVIKGTSAVGRFGPDLTHLMSRQTLLTGMVPNDRKELTAWVHRPDSLKPVCLMPDLHLTDAETKLVVDYLLTLK